jgi:hypothetical protein
MDATGGFIQTVLDRTRAYLDDPSIDAKYDDNFLVKHVISPMFASVSSRINNSLTNPISVWIPFPLTQGTQYYALPPCVGEVWRMAIRNDDKYVSREAMPRTEYHYRGPNWKVEGNMIVFNPTPDQDYDDIELQFMHNGEIMPFITPATLVGPPVLATIGSSGAFTCTTATTIVVGQDITITGTNGGTGIITGYTTGKKYYVIATNGSTSFTLSETAGGDAISTTAGSVSGLTCATEKGIITIPLSTSPTVGVIDRRDNAYLGSTVRILTTTGIIEERIVSAWTKDNTLWKTTVRLPFTYASAGTVTVEYAPFGLESLYEAVAVGGAMKLGTYKKIPMSQFQLLQLQYKDAMKTCMDHFSSQQMRVPKYFERSTADNKLNDWRNI